MKEMIKQLVLTLIGVGVLALDWYTLHPAFMFIFGAMSVVTTLLMVVAIASGVWMIRTGRVGEIVKAPKLTNFQIALSVLYQVGALAYLLSAQHFVNATLFIVAVLLTWLMIGGFAFVRRQEASGELQDD